MGVCLCCAGMLDNDKTQFKGGIHALDMFANVAVSESHHSLQNE